MPLDEKILGFSNRWYRPAMDTAIERELGAGLRIRVVNPVFFCATKLQAFVGRGKGDYQASHDLEDLVTVIDGRQELVHEIGGADVDVRTYIAMTVQQVLKNAKFVDALPGYLLPDAASQGRLRMLLERFKQIAALT